MAVPLTFLQRQKLRGPTAMRCLIDFYFDTGRYSFWDGDPHLEYDETTYFAASAFLSASSVTMGVDLGAEGVEVILDGTRLAQALDDDSDPAQILGQIDEENYQQRRGEIRYAFFDSETGELYLVRRQFAGLVDQMPLQEILSDNGAATVQLRCLMEAVVRRYGRRLGRTRSHEDQREIDATDDFFKFCSASVAAEQSIVWGQATSKPRSLLASASTAANALNPTRSII